MYIIMYYKQCFIYQTFRFINLKVVGSNPTPATTLKALSLNGLGLFGS